MRVLYLLAVLPVLFLVVACEDDKTTDPPAPQSADFMVTIENVAMAKTYPVSGVFNTPVGAGAPAAIGPGEAYEFTFDAAPGDKLQFATMFVQSNDLFYAPIEAGIELFNGGSQVTGDMTAQILLWDSGSEVNQEPGSGADQAPRQSGPNTGAVDPDNTVREAPDTFGNLPAVASVIEVTLSSSSATGFMLRIENVSDANTLTYNGGTTAIPLAPGVFVVYSGDNPLFTSGQADAGNGLAALAEDGDPSGLADDLDMDTGITQIMAPGVWTVHSGSNILFTNNQPDAGEGLEALAEDGDPSGLAAAVTAKSDVSSSGVFNTPVGAGGPGAITPGNSYSFTFSAEEGEKLSLATMFVQSNDLFYAPDGDGIELFDGTGNAVSGDITAQMMLWDAGTEQNEKPGFGQNQAPRQSGADTGADEGGNVRQVNDGFSYPAVNEVVRVTMTVQ